MLALDSPEWTKLGHAYGEASNIPGLLRRLAEVPGPSSSPEDEPWMSLWSALCHQGDVYSASYAAVPHLVHIAEAAVGPIDASFFALSACIEVARARGMGPELPVDMRDEYFEALKGVHDCAHRHAGDAWDEGMTRSVAAALAASKGHIDLAEALINLDADIVSKIVVGDF